MSTPRKLPPEVCLGGNFYMGSYHSTSADPPKSDLWHKAVGKSGRLWLYHPDKSSVWVDGGKGSNGCGGRTIPFSLEDGSTVEMTGPWHSNADAFFKDCGIDVRENFWTWGCVGTERLYDKNTERSGIGNLIWFDPAPVKGAFDRVDVLAWELQQKHPDIKLQAYRESDGGSSLGGVDEPPRLKRARNDPDQLLHDKILKEMFDE